MEYQELRQFIGNRVRGLRQEKRLGQKDLGKLTGVHYKTIENIETKGKGINIKTLFKISSALNIEIAEFFPPLLKTTITIKHDDLRKIIEKL
jgi:transcriptional regulator with XRE-family HTH domain